MLTSTRRYRPTRMGLENELQCQGISELVKGADDHAGKQSTEATTFLGLYLHTYVVRKRLRHILVEKLQLMMQETAHDKIMRSALPTRVIDYNSQQLLLCKRKNC